MQLGIGHYPAAQSMNMVEDGFPNILVTDDTQICLFHHHLEDVFPVLSIGCSVGTIGFGAKGHECFLWKEDDACDTQTNSAAPLWTRLNWSATWPNRVDGVFV
jgi:hypothetical protein